MQESYFITVSCLPVSGKCQPFPCFFGFLVIVYSADKPPQTFIFFCFWKTFKTEVLHLAKTYFCDALLGFLNVFLSIRIKNSVQRHTLVKDLYVTFLIMYVFIIPPCRASPCCLRWRSEKFFVLIYDFKTSVDTGFYYLK